MLAWFAKRVKKRRTLTTKLCHYSPKLRKSQENAVPFNFIGFF